MTRQLTIALTIIAASILAASQAHADCGSHGCQKRYGQYSARQAFIIFQQRPEMIQQFPQIARELETQFGAIQPAATRTPASIPATPAIPAVAPAQIPVTPQTPAVIDQTPAASEAPVEAAPIEPPVETAAPIDANANPDAPPADLPIEEPPVNV